MKLIEIFKSIQGESTYAGFPCAFVRLAECNLRCSYCDTRYAYEARFVFSPEQVMARVKELGCLLVEITGGEPLLQDEVYPLMERLLASGYHVLLETNGSLNLERVDPRVVKIVDIKCPGSGQAEHNLWSNLELLRLRDEVKFVLCHREDYLWARKVIGDYCLTAKCKVLLSPAFGFLSPKELAEWILADGLPVRLQLQWHKFIWGPDAQGV